MCIRDRAYTLMWKRRRKYKPYNIQGSVASTMLQSFIHYYPNTLPQSMSVWGLKTCLDFMVCLGIKNWTFRLVDKCHTHWSTMPIVFVYSHTKHIYVVLTLSFKYTFRNYYCRYLVLSFENKCKIWIVEACSYSKRPLCMHIVKKLCL